MRKRPNGICQRGHFAIIHGRRDCKQCYDFMFYKSHLKRTYNLSFEEFTKRILESNGRCELCFKPFRNSRDVNIDHDHSTKKFRGILCTACNHKLMTLDLPSFMTAALKYLKKPITVSEVN